MDVLDTSAHSMEESLHLLLKEFNKYPVLILTGPQGGGKTTLAIRMLSESAGAMFEGRARTAQPVVLVRRDAVEKMKAAVYEKRTLPILDEDGSQIFAEVSYYDHLKLLIEGIFDVMELGEQELVGQVTALVNKLGLGIKSIELYADDEVLIKRRLARHLDAEARLRDLLEKEKKYGIESNILGIQGAKVADPIHRKGIARYADDQISRTIEDFHHIIPTKDMTVKQCLEKMIRISADENKESGFLVLHTDDGEKIASDLVVGKTSNSLVGVTLLEIYIGFRQNRTLYRAYRHAGEGQVEVVHTYTPMLQEFASIADPSAPPRDTTAPILSSADRAAAERFNLIVTVIDSEGRIESTSKKRQQELMSLLMQP